MLVGSKVIPMGLPDPAIQTHLFMDQMAEDHSEIIKITIKWDREFSTGGFFMFGQVFPQKTLVHRRLVIQWIHSISSG